MNNLQTILYEDISCPIGCEKNDKLEFKGCDLLQGLPGEFTIVRCRNCGLLRTNPRPTPETMGFYYPDNYGPYAISNKKEIKLGLMLKNRELFKSLSKKIINFNTHRLPMLLPGRLLEVGCASGEFLDKMAKLGWQVEGVEFSEKAAQVAANQGYHVHAGQLETAPDPNEPFDLIVGWMVLEHLHDPVNALKKLRKWSKPGAKLVVSLPNAGSLEFNLFKKYWYGLHLPNHLYHFTPNTLALLFNAGGWEIEKIFHQRILSNWVGSIGYVLYDKGFEKLGKKFIEIPCSPGKWNYVLFPFAWLLSLLGQTGRMTVWARIR